MARFRKRLFSMIALTLILIIVKAIWMVGLMQNEHHIDIKHPGRKYPHLSGTKRTPLHNNAVSPARLSSDEENSSMRKPQNKEKMMDIYARYSSEERRQSKLRKIAQEYGTLKTDVFVESCAAYTPLNFCAEVSRLRGEGSLCQGNHSCAEEMVKWGTGSELVVSAEHGPLLVENGVFLLPVNHSDLQSASHHGRYPSQPDPRQSLTGKEEEDVRVATDLRAYIPLSYDIFFEGEATEAKISTTRTSPPKIILWYTGPRYSPKIKGLERLPACPQFPCVMTSNREYTNISSAILFNSAFNIAPKPIQRQPQQMFVYHNQEPSYASHHKKFNAYKKEWRSEFNWTMTYRHDSDFISPFGILRRKTGQSSPTRNEPFFKGDSFKNYTEIWSKKIKMAAILVSNCQTPSRRDEYYKELQRYIQVDVWGKCGNITCPRGEDEKCLENISTEYKFYLGFESAFCGDYITEKLFRYLKADLVLVVRGTDQYTAHSPREIVLNAADYRYPRLLAERMTYLASHPEEYMKILRAKDDYVIVDEDYTIADNKGRLFYVHYHYENVPFCQMCQRLWNLEKYAKTIPDIKKWFDEKSCLAEVHITDLFET